MDEFTVIGFDTREPKGGLQHFKVFSLNGETTEHVIDRIAHNQAGRSTHIIYTVVPTSDLWW